MHIAHSKIVVTSSIIWQLNQFENWLRINRINVGFIYFNNNGRERLLIIEPLSLNTFILPITAILMSPFLNYKSFFLIALKFPPQSHYTTRNSSIKFQMKLFKPKSNQNKKESHPRVVYLTTNILIYPTYIRVMARTSLRFYKFFNFLLFRFIHQYAMFVTIFPIAPP